MLKLIQILLSAAVLAPSIMAGLLTPVTNPALLNVVDSADWGQLGPDFTTVTSPANATSLLGLAITVANGSQDFYSVQQGNSWGGNFNNGDNVLFNQAGGPMTLSFNLPLGGIGLRFQSLNFGTFIASITAFGAGNTNFGTVSANGTSDNAADGSALFLGVLSSSTDITSVVLNVQVGGLDDPFAIGTLKIADVSTGAVPEPGTMIFVGAGLLAGVARIRKVRALRA